MESIYHIDSPFSNYWTNELEDKARSNLSWEKKFPNYFEISVIFERTQATKENMSSQSTSFAAFKGQNSFGVKTKTTPPPPSNLKKSLCPYCWSHYYAECYYINKKTRPTNFKPSSEWLQKLEALLMDPANRKKNYGALQKAELFKLRQATKLVNKTSN